MTFDYGKLKLEIDDLKTTVDGQITARADLEAATANAAAVAQSNADKLARMQADIAAAQKEADDKLQAATVASQVADKLVEKQVAYLVALIKQEDPGEDPTPDAPPTPPNTLNTPTV